LIFGSREKQINRKLNKYVITTIEEVIHTPLQNMLGICSRQIAQFFETRYACIHFTKDLGLPWDDALAALHY